MKYTDDSEIDEESKNSSEELRSYGSFIYILCLLPVINTIILITILIPITQKYLLP